MREYLEIDERVDLGGGGTAFYVYDSSGERMRKIIEKTGGIVEERIYLGGYEVYRKTISGILDFERETLHISDDTKKIASIETKTVENGSVISSPASNIRYQYDNHLGSASLELDDTAAIISYEEYHPFGTTSYRSGRTETEVSLKRYKYVGKERDEETGLYYYGARYYAGWLGRFVSCDPMKEERQWLNPYNYVQNNPINRIDPTGALDDDPPKGADPDLYKEDSGVIQNNNGSKLKENPFFDSQKTSDKSKVNNIGSVHFANKETENIVREAMANDADFAEKVMSLTDSEMTYTFDWKGEVDLMSTEKNSANGSFGANKDTGEVVIGFETYKNGTELGPLTSLYHETQHAIQFERGHIGFKNINGEWEIDSNTYDILDEVEAFDAGYNSPGYKEDARIRWNKKSQTKKALKIKRLTENYKDIFKMHGINPKPDRNPGAHSKSLFKNDKFIRFVYKND